MHTVRENQIKYDRPFSSHTREIDGGIRAQLEHYTLMVVSGLLYNKGPKGDYCR